jgi:hypothetical protein
MMGGGVLTADHPRDARQIQQHGAVWLNCYMDFVPPPHMPDLDAVTVVGVEADETVQREYAAVRASRVAAARIGIAVSAMKSFCKPLLLLA